MPSGDAFAAAEPAAGGDDAAGRAMRENVQYSRRLATILSSKKK
jgi:ribosomal protein S6E (S10)